MAILQECSHCHRKQAVKNKVCLCGADLDKLKRAKKAKYWITYRLPGGKQRKELIGLSIEEARDAEGKRRVQKRENRIFDIKPDSNMTFQELTDWYLALEKVKALSSFWRVKICLNNFNQLFGNMIINQIKPTDLENYQVKRKAEGRADKTVDDEIAQAQTVVSKAFDNDIVSGDTLKVFKRVNKLLKRNSNARNRILNSDEYEKLFASAPAHLKGILATGYYTGMREGEILNLTRDKLDLKERLIKLEATDTKDKEPRIIPICDKLHEILSAVPRAIHDPHVFLFKGQPMKIVNRSLQTACKEAGILWGRFKRDGFVFHDLRHTFNTNMRKAGVPESVIMQVTGHSTREMFDRYNTIDTEDTRQAINQLQGYLQSVAQNVAQTPKNENLEKKHG
jgi:integrase